MFGQLKWMDKDFRKRKVWQMNRSAKRLLIINTILLWWIIIMIHQIRQSFPLATKISHYMVYFLYPADLLLNICHIVFCVQNNTLSLVDYSIVGFVVALCFVFCYCACLVVWSLYLGNTPIALITSIKLKSLFKDYLATCSGYH